MTQVGDYVKVEADRGEDLGMVLQIFPLPEAGRPLPATAGQKRGFGQFEKEHIIRAATEDEVMMMTMLKAGLQEHHEHQEYNSPYGLLIVRRLCQDIFF